MSKKDSLHNDDGEDAPQYIKELHVLWGGMGHPVGPGHGEIQSRDGLNASYIREPGGLVILQETTNSSNGEPLAPSVYSLSGYPAFSAKIDGLCLPNNQPITKRQFIELAREALALKQRHPILRSVVALDMACVGAGLEATESRKLNSIIPQLWDLFVDLEVPDDRVVSQEAFERGDFSEVQQKWDRIEELLLTQ